jgi:uncharacterized protein YdhG (YjbR/CyaY superfamily)
MEAVTTRFKTVEEYLSALPENKRVVAEKLRAIIKQAAPKAEEMISYNMPAFKLNGILVYYAAHKEHIGFYPGAAINKEFLDELVGYETSKGTIKFSLAKPLPVGLIKKIVKFRLKENEERVRIKESRRK